MRRILAALVVLLLAWPAPADDEKPGEKPKDKAQSSPSVPAVEPLNRQGGGQEPAQPGTPAAEYQSLVKAYNQAFQTIFKEYQKAEGEDRQELFRKKRSELTEKFVPQFLELAEKNPKDPVALDALTWIVKSYTGRAADQDSSPARAMAILTRDHVTSEIIGSVCQALSYRIHDPRAEPLLRAILEKNPSQTVRAEACLALAQFKSQLSQLVRQLAADPTEVAAIDPSAVVAIEQIHGKEYVEALRKKDAAKIEAECDGYYQKFADQYAAAVKPDRLANIFLMLGFSADKSGEKFLRTLLAKDGRKEVQAVATLTLAQVLKRQADVQSGEPGEKMRKECEALFEQAIEKYGDVPMPFYETVGKKAKGELHALRFLAVGQAAPEVEGVDQDGRHLKLSDYKGKVVLLDFWSQH